VGNRVDYIYICFIYNYIYFSNKLFARTNLEYLPNATHDGGALGELDIMGLTNR
jgi:hypothetical protein